VPAGRPQGRAPPRECQRACSFTRLNLNDLANGVSDIEAIRFLLSKGARIRGIKHLHAKLYLLGANHGIVTSANLTQLGLTRNHGLGYVVRENGGFPGVYWKQHYATRD
jgi:hypothetical protein